MSPDVATALSTPVTPWDYVHREIPPKGLTICGMNRTDDVPITSLGDITCPICIKREEANRGEPIS